MINKRGLKISDNQLELKNRVDTLLASEEILKKKVPNQSKSHRKIFIRMSWSHQIIVASYKSV